MQVGILKSIQLIGNSLSRSPHIALFHSTPFSRAKWRNKWKNTDEGDQKHSKNYIRYAVRQKRADTKRALKNFLLYGGSSDLHLQDEDMYWHANDTSNRNAKVESSSEDFNDIPQSTSSRKSKPRSSGKDKSGSKCWRKKQRLYDEDDYGQPETILRTTFGKHRCYTWSFPTWEKFFENPTPGFEWREESKENESKRRVWSESDLDEEESSDIGSYSHRVALGLPPTGPLKLADIKSAFHACALKWHPDKHQGTSQAMAEEKFKLCVDAYNSLCCALKAT